MATITQSAQPQTKPTAQSGYPESSLRFDWAATILACIYIAGLWIDGWAHFHNRTDNTFFTPWHFLFYSAFGMTAAFVGYNQWRNLNKGYTFQKALPKGYWLALIGVVIFALGGVGDMIWHTLFGIEGGTEALTSPTHIMLAIGMGLVFSGPLRAAWNRPADGTQRSWRALGPALITSTLLLALISFFTGYAHPVVSPLALFGNTGGRANPQDFGVTSVLLQAGLMSAFIIFLAWRWRLPFGTFTLLFTVVTAMLTVMNDFFLLIPGALIAGLIADVLYWRWKPSLVNEGHFHRFAFIVPTVYYILYFITLQIAGGIRWHIHVWGGAIFLSGLIGLLLSYLVSELAHVSVRMQPENQ